MPTSMEQLIRQGLRKEIERIAQEECDDACKIATARIQSRMGEVITAAARHFTYAMNSEPFDSTYRVELKFDSLAFQVGRGIK